MVQMLISDSSPAGLENISSRMPARIEDALNFPVVKEVVKVAGEEAVKKYLQFELIKLANLVSVGGNLNNAQVVFIAAELIRTFQNETLADFKLCFQQGASGAFGEIFRLDGIVIRAWMVSYLEIKYQVLENELYKEKESLYNMPAQTLSEEAQRQKLGDRLQAWKSAIEAANLRAISPLTDEDIRKEGKVEPMKSTPYKSTNTPEYFVLKEKIRRTASDFYKDRYSFSGMKIYQVTDQEVFAETEADAIKIYEMAIAIDSIAGPDDYELSKLTTHVQPQRPI